MAGLPPKCEAGSGRAARRDEPLSMVRANAEYKSATPDEAKAQPASGDSQRSDVLTAEIDNARISSFSIEWTFAAGTKAYDAVRHIP